MRTVVKRPKAAPRNARAKMVLSTPGDEYERQADQIADRVVGMQARSGRAGGTAASPAPLLVDDALAAPGQPLDSGTRDFMEPRFGHDFSHVRVHSGTTAARSAQEVDARAYTVGHHIVLGAGQPATGTSEGRRLLAHELTHVVQQTGVGGAKRSPGTHGMSPKAVQPMVQRDLAIEPPRPDAVGLTLTEAQMAASIAFDIRVLGSIPDSEAVIELIRDVLGVSKLPAVVDEDFVNGVVRWQASYGLAQDGRLGPTTARPLFREIGAEGAGHGEVRRPPRYTPAGPINVPRAGARQAPFDMSAEFTSDPANGVLPSCCEVRQDIRWDAAFVAASAAAGNPVVPHAGFPAAHPANRWIEDRDAAGLRYGHRSGPFTDPGPGDRYLDTAGRQNQAFGHRYRAQDTPTGLAADRGSWRFRLRVIDVCNGDAQLAVSPALVINWL